MTAPAAERAHGAPTAPPAAALVVTTLVTAVLLGLVGAASAGAAWTGSATRGSGQLQAAVLVGRLDVRTSATSTPPPGTDRHVQLSLLSALSTTSLDLVNASSVPAAVDVTVTSTQALGVVSVLERCSVPWTAAGVCAPGATTVARAWGGVLNTAQATWTAPVTAVGGRHHLRLSVPASAVGGVTVAVKVVPTPTDRSAG